MFLVTKQHFLIFLTSLGSLGWIFYTVGIATPNMCELKTAVRRNGALTFKSNYFGAFWDCVEYMEVESYSFMSGHDQVSKSCQTLGSEYDFPELHLVRAIQAIFILNVLFAATTLGMTIASLVMVWKLKTVPKYMPNCALGFAIPAFVLHILISTPTAAVLSAAYKIEFTLGYSFVLADIGISVVLVSASILHLTRRILSHNYEGYGDQNGIVRTEDNERINL